MVDEREIKEIDLCQTHTLSHIGEVKIACKWYKRLRLCPIRKVVPEVVPLPAPGRHPRPKAERQALKGGALPQNRFVALYLAKLGDGQTWAKGIRHENESGTEG